jgi:hypothetical protein
MIYMLYKVSFTKQYIYISLTYSKSNGCTGLSKCTSNKYNISVFVQSVVVLDGLYKYTDSLIHNGMDSIKQNKYNTILRNTVQAYIHTHTT